MRSLTYEDVLPATLAGALSGVGGIVGGGDWDDATYAGYMVVEGSLPSRQESDVSLVADLSIVPRSYSSEAHA